jgi:hypothetical protein
MQAAWVVSCVIATVILPLKCHGSLSDFSLPVQIELDTEHGVHSRIRRSSDAFISADAEIALSRRKRSTDEVGIQVSVHVSNPMSIQLPVTGFRRIKRAAGGWRIPLYYLRKV